MLNPRAINIELERTFQKLENFLTEREKAFENYRTVLEKLSEMPPHEIMKTIESQECEAIPSEEINTRNIFVSFDKKWENLEEALSWAKEILLERTTFAVDGGQDFFEKELNLPIAIIQVGWFINNHKQNGDYQKNNQPYIITPEEILNRKNKEMTSKNYIGQRRFSLEIEKTKEFVQSKAKWQQRKEKMPVVFFDGAFVISLSRREIQSDMIRQINDLVELSRKNKVPVVGYIDRSNSHELLSFFNYFNKDEKIQLDDLLLIDILGTLKNLGDRTIFFYSRRRDLLRELTIWEGLPIGFVYMKTSTQSLPARIDIPSWVYEEGYLDEVLKVVLAECIASRQGYPYCLICADQMAYISGKEREYFLQRINSFMKQNSLEIKFSRKFLSKRANRIV